ncbi:hypothetical protein [Streptomyces sp. NPDC005494]
MIESTREKMTWLAVLPRAPPPDAQANNCRHVNMAQGLTGLGADHLADEP